MAKAVIFDMNGVIIVDEKYHNESWQILCNNYGFTLTEEDFKKHVMGKRDKDTLDYLFKRKLSLEDTDKCADERDAIVKRLVKGKLALPDGLLELLEEIKNKNIPLAIATSSRRGYVDFIMENFGLRKYFPIIVTAEDITNGKPDPEIYLKTAGILSVNPDEVLAFEDSITGIKAAKSAGMKVVGVSSSVSEEELSKIADVVIGSFKEFSRGLL